MLGSISENRDYYAQYDWSSKGEEWSWYWGSTETMWRRSVYPRISDYLPAKNIVEIGCGYGRVASHLQNACTGELYLLDIMDACVSACKEKFAFNKNVHCLKTDGKSLEGIADNSIDFVFSFYSLVGVNIDVIARYIEEISRVLKPEGVAFLHHSNAGAYCNANQMHDKRVQLLAAYRDISVEADTVRQLIYKKHMYCLSQERICWDINNVLSDCFTLFSNSENGGEHSFKNFANVDFQMEMKAIHRNREVGK